MKTSTRIVALTFAAHLLAVVLMLALHPALSITPDTLTYSQPAHAMLEGRGFSSPHRLPGYPLLIAAAFRLTGDERAVLLVAPVLAAIACYVLMGLTMRLSPRAAPLAGLLFACYPGSLTLSGLMMTDAIGGYLVVLAAWATVLAFEGRRWALPLAAAAWLAGELLRPPLALSGLFIAALWLVYCRPQWRQALVLTLATLPVPLVFAVVNLGSYGVFTPSLLSVETAREYLYTHVEIQGTDWQAHERMITLRAENNAVCEVDYGCKYRLQSAQMAALTAQHGYGAVLRAMAVEAREQLATGYAFFTYGVFPDLLLLFYWLLILIAAIVGTGQALRQRNFFPVALWLIFAYFVVTGATSAWVGARLRFSGDLMLLPLAALAFQRARREKRVYNKLSHNV